MNSRLTAILQLSSNSNIDGMFQTLKLIPAKVLRIDGEMLGIVAFGAVATAAVLLPFLDREKPLRTRRLITGLASLFLGYMAAMTIYGWVAK